MKLQMSSSCTLPKIRLHPASDTHTLFHPHPTIINTNTNNISLKISPNQTKPNQKPFLSAMNSFADLPAVTEPHAGDTNPPSFTGNGAHPPYSEMIIAAIGGLKDKDGSSRQAIAKYIEKEYGNLPETHQNLLTQHLKRMKNQGDLMMVKHSYMIPPLPFQPHFTDDYTENSNSSLIPRRKPGRPPKHRHDFGYQQPPPPEIQPYQPQFEQQHHLNSGQDFQTGLDLQSQYGSGSGSGNSNYTEPMFASLAPPPENPVPVSAKRGRGRPPKVKFAGANTSAGVVSERRKPGRPPISMVNGVKRGRPKRIGGPGPGPVTVPLSGNGNGYVSTGRPRGRPKRQPVSVDALPVSRGRGRGRGRGRPPKNNFRNLTSQSYGPPTKVGPGTAVLVTDPHQLVAYQELKSKYEHLQSKAKEVVGVVRPYINPDYEAFGALQELETLLGPDVNVQSEKAPSFV